LNIWGAYFGSWDRKIYSFPFTTCTGQTFPDRGSLLFHIIKEHGKDPSQGLYFSVLGLCPLNLLYDQEIQDHIARYLYCEKFHSQAYPGSYEDLPAFWVDFCNVMAVELVKCAEEKLRQKK
jgi:hypothetical protein